MSRRWRYPRPRRGQILPVPPDQQSPAWSRFRDQQKPRIRGLLLRRGRFFALGGTDSTPPASWPRARRSGIRPRCGVFFAVVPVPVVLAPPRPPDAITRERLHFAGLHRGRYLPLPPPAPAAPVPPPWVPPYTTARRPLWRPVRRSRFTAVPPHQPTPPPTGRRRTPTPPGRHGHRYDPPWITTPLAPARPPDRLTGRRRAAPPVRRHHFTEPPWPQAIPPVAPLAIPQIIRTRRRLAVARRGCFWAWSIYQAAEPVVTDLPDLTATETVLDRRSATETHLGQLTATETATGRISASRR